MKKPLFVIQKHHASTLHYDFRLQVGDVLKSWVIPKGPSLNPANKRLAILTEDHALDYADFEGEIPAGEYGAGKVIVWDRGTYKHITAQNDKPISIDEAFENGEITVFLRGEKLKGKFSLILMKKQDESKNWLLIKYDDDYAEDQFNPVDELPNSIISNKSVDEI